MDNTLSKCIKHLYPNAEPFKDILLNLTEDGKEEIIFWNELKLGPQPKIEDLLKSKDAAEAAEQLEICRRRRKTAYPPAADYLDGIVKGDQAQIQKYIDECLAVKAKFPKP